MLAEGVVSHGRIANGEPGVDYFTHLPAEGGGLLTDDYSFCERVRKTSNVTIWAYAGPGVGHVGYFTYRAGYLDYIKTISQSGRS